MWTGPAPGPGITGEFALLARNRIPGLVRAHDLSRDAETGQPFIVEDHVAGVDAGAWLAAAHESDKSDRVGALLAQVAATLSSLHDLGFVHGDLKPAHVRFGADDRATLVDLGSAVSRGADPPAGGVGPITRGFAAPELLAGSPGSVASDLYALGALVYAIGTGRAPSPERARGVRDLAPWLSPKLGGVVDRLIAPHPRDRPASARELLSALGTAQRAGGWTGDARWIPIGREGIFEELRRPTPGGIRYLTGASGMGKTHLLRGLVGAAQIAGRNARLMTFTDQAVPQTGRLVAFLRHAEKELPFVHWGTDPLLLAIDDLESAPAELAAALDLYRCRAARDQRLDIVAAARTPPPGARALELAPLSESEMRTLGQDFGAPDGAGAALRVADGNPGLLAAWIGRIPLSKAAVLERMKSIPAGAVEALASIAIAGGALAQRTLRASFPQGLDAALVPLMEASLVTRTAQGGEATYHLTARGIAGELAESLSTFEVAERLACALLADVHARAESILAVASAPTPPSRRTDLLRWCAQRAREEEAREVEMDALMALGANPDERTSELLFRLERLTRDTGRGVHPKVLSWLEELGHGDAKARPLALRRRAEMAARSGEHAEALRLVDASDIAAREIGDGAAVALARATKGAIALYRADWVVAGDELRAAQTELPGDHADREEVARIEHNLGVVAIYQGRLTEAADALERALSVKRELGDRAGVRSCLLNLGITLTKLEEYDDAELLLDEALALAESLGQTAGRGWCLAARADVALRKRDVAGAERGIAEAEALRDALPAALRCDLTLLRAGAFLIEGDGASALRAIAELAADPRRTDALIDARASILEARAHLSSLPADRKKAARAAISAVRRARGSSLSDVEKEALAVLQSVRPVRRSPAIPKAPPTTPDARYDDAVALNPASDATWAWMHRLAQGLHASDAGFELAKLAVSAAGAERGFVALVDRSDRVLAAFGADLDGLPIADAEARVPKEELAGALRKKGPIYFPEAPSPAGNGSRLAVAGPEAAVRPVLVLEHRFKTHAFDGLTSETTERWATLAGILARIHGTGDEGSPAGEHARPSASVEPREPSRLYASTSLPLPRPRREYPTLIGDSEALRRALSQLDAAVDSDLPVLIVGETGTGKEVFARALHEMGRRARHPFVAVNCGAVTDSLFEAEFFGHAKGSFTGADRARRGLFAQADRGTLLLDEVGELPLVRQASLLRVLESSTYRPVGSDEEHRFDVRIVAATNRDLAKASEEGAFRKDLRYRLEVLQIRIPPLRERTGDVPLLVRHFLTRAGSRARPSEGALEALAAYAWPGNVRELMHLVDRLAALPVTTIEPQHLPKAIRGALPALRRTPATREDRERHEVLRALEKTEGNITRAAERLGLTRHGLKKKLVRLGIRPAKAEGQ
jgi:transcriptional regulator with GAF, ATPase, and Fis domain/tetratricopeptide (TPR) repeat protein